MITLRTKRSGNALLVVASRFVHDVTIIIINNNLATSKSHNPMFLSGAYKLQDTLPLVSWLRLGLDFGLRLRLRYVPRASGFESWPSQRHAQDTYYIVRYWQRPPPDRRNLNDACSLYMRRSVRLATEMAEKKCQCDCSSCVREDKLRNASNTLAVHDETTSSE